MRPRPVLISGLFAVALLPACGGDDGESSGTTSISPATTTATASTPVIDPGDGGDYHPDVDAANFVAAIDNPYLPWIPGSSWVYEGESEGEPERVEIVVTDENKTVMGIEATVVRDSVYSGDELKEDTFDWYAQDRDGNVWYLGEDTKEYENGEVVSTEGSWEAGVDGAQPGIVMPAEPAVGFAYRQEYYAGEAEDMGEIIEVGGTVDVPAGHYEDVVITKDWTPLDPEMIEQKQYAPGVGTVHEQLVAGGDEVLELVEFHAGG